MSETAGRLPLGRVKAPCAAGAGLVPGPGAVDGSEAGHAWMRPASRQRFWHVAPFTAWYAATSTMDLQALWCLRSSVWLTAPVMYLILLVLSEGVLGSAKRGHCCQLKAALLALCFRQHLLRCVWNPV